MTGADLLRWRTAAKLSPVQTARLFGVAHSTIARWESGAYESLNGSAQALLRLLRHPTLGSEVLAELRRMEAMEKLNAIGRAKILSSDYESLSEPERALFNQEIAKAMGRPI